MRILLILIIKKIETNIIYKKSNVTNVFSYRLSGKTGGKNMQAQFN